MKLQFEPFYQEYLDVLAAYDLASATMYTDQWTVAPKGGIPNSRLPATAIRAGCVPTMRTIFILPDRKSVV